MDKPNNSCVYAYERKIRRSIDKLVKICYIMDDGSGERTFVFEPLTITPRGKHYEEERKA